MGWSGGTYRKGNYGTNGWTGDASLGIGIEAGRHDTQDDDFANGINACLNKDGSNTATGNLNIGANRVTNIAIGTARGDAAQVGQVQDSALKWGGTSGGSANAQTLTLSPVITAYAAGQRFSFLAGFTNTAAATLNVNGVGTKNIFNAATGAAIGAGEIVSGRAYEVLYDGTQFQLLNDITPVQNGDYIWLGTAGGTTTALTASATPAITAYKTGQKFRLITASGSTGSTATAHTLAINGLASPKNIVNNEDSTNPTLGTWVSGALLELVYDGTNFRIVNDAGGWISYTPTIATTSGGSISSVVATRAQYRKRGKSIELSLYVTFSTTGVGSTITCTLPVNSNYGGANYSIVPYRSLTGTTNGIGIAINEAANNIYTLLVNAAVATWGTASSAININFTYASV